MNPMLFPDGGGNPLLAAGEYINEAAGRRRDERQARQDAIGNALLQTWPAQAGKAVVDALSLPGDVYAGRVDPMSDEGIGRSAELAGMMTLGSAAMPAPRGSLTMGAARRGGDLPMDDASRMTRAREMGYDERPFFRGDGGISPDEYPRGAHFTSDPDYNAGGFGENREFRLNLQNALVDEAPVTARQLGAIVEAARERDPKLAADLAGLFDRDVDWLIGYGRARPDAEVMEAGAMLRSAVERSAAPEDILRAAGFDAVMSGHEVRKIGGQGIRHKDAAFDPQRATEGGIMLGLGGLSAAPLMYPSEDQR